MLVTAFVGGPKAAAVWVPIVSAVVACAGVLTACVAQLSNLRVHLRVTSLGRWPWLRLITGAAICAAAVGVVAFAAPSLFRDIVTVPNVGGMSRPAAASAFDAAGIKVAQVAEEPANLEIGHVIRQQPQAGEHLEGPVDGSLVVSRGIEVPSLLGSSLAEAKAELRNENLRWGKFSRAFSSAPMPGVMPTARGAVLDQTPDPGVFINPQSAIKVVQSKGVRVPGVVGRPPVAAKQALIASGFEVEERSEFNRRYTGLIGRQEPAGDTGLDAGGRVTIVRSRGPEPRARITSPKPGQRVRSALLVTVKLRDDQVSSRGHFWLATAAPYGLLPKEPKIERMRTSTQTIHESGEGLIEFGRRYDLVVLRVSRAGNDTITRWLSRGHRTGLYPPLGPGTGSPLSGLQILARVPGLRVRRTFSDSSSASGLHTSRDPAANVSSEPDGNPGPSLTSWTMNL